eukprot:gene4617-5060_t
MQFILFLACLCLSFAQLGAWRVCPAVSSVMHRCHSLSRGWALQSTNEVSLSPQELALDIGEFEGTKFNKLQTLGGDLGKFRIETVLPAEALKSYLDEYMQEMKRRKVSFPGFRQGKLPPAAMEGVRKYLVSFGLETMIGQLCNNNNIRITKEDGSDAAFGEDAFFQEIVLPDAQGRDFNTRQAAWKEGQDFPFVAEFFGATYEDESEEVIDTEEVNEDKQQEAQV